MAACALASSAWRGAVLGQYCSRQERSRITPCRSIFDQTREISVTGVTPESSGSIHTRISGWTSATREGGTVEWLVEMGAMNTMRRAGFQTDRFSLGQLVTITGWPGGANWWCTSTGP